MLRIEGITVVVVEAAAAAESDRESFVTGSAEEVLDAAGLLVAGIEC